MSVSKHVFEGKTAIVAVLPDGSVINANVEDFTLYYDDHQWDDDFIDWSDARYIRPVSHDYSIGGDLVPITDSGTIFEIRSPVNG